MYNKPIYLDVVSNIKEYIISHHLLSGDKLPSEKQLMALFHISRTTLRRSLQILEEEGLVIKRQGKGTFVSRTLTPQHFTKVATLLPKGSQLFGEELLYHLSAYALEKTVEFNYFFYDSTTEAKSELFIEAFLRKTDGVIIWPEPSNKRFLEKLIATLTALNIPVVLVDRSLAIPRPNFVATDNKKAMALALNHLLNNQHQNIALCSRPSQDDSSLISRVASFKTAVQSKGLEFNLCLLENFLPDISLNNNVILAQFLLNHPTVTAFIITEYTSAVLLYDSLLELGYTIPKDYSLLCFDFTHNFSHNFPIFTHIKQDEQTLAQEAFDLLLELINSPKKLATKRLLSPTLVVGNTVIKQRHSDSQRSLSQKSDSNQLN